MLKCAVRSCLVSVHLFLCATVLHIFLSKNVYGSFFGTPPFQTYSEKKTEKLPQQDYPTEH